MYKESIVNTNPIKAVVGVIGLKLKNSFWKIIQYENPKTIKINRAALIVLKGLHILYKWINPVIAVKKTHKEVSKPSCKRKIFVNIVTKIILKTTVNAVGKLLLTIFNKNWPFTKSLFGSKAKIKEGIPIVKPVIKVNCIGIKKYLEEIKMLNNIKRTV